MWFSFFYFLASVYGHINHPTSPEPVKSEIKIELRLKPSQLKDSGTINFGSADIAYKLFPKINSELKKPVDGLVQINMHIDGPSYIDFSNILSVKKRGNYLVEFGDSILITSNGDGFDFSGNGAAKYRLQYQLDSLAKNLPRPNNKTGSAAFYIDSIGEYFQFERYYENRIIQELDLINRQKGRISEFAFDRIKDNSIRLAIVDLSGKFSALKRYMASRKMPAENLVCIYDSSYSMLVQKWAGISINKQAIELALRTNQIERAYGFDNLKMPAEREMQIREYEDRLKIYKGEQREKLIVNALPDLMVKAGFTPKIEALIAAYYSEPGFPVSKSWVKKQEQEARLTWLSFKAPEFMLPDARGNLISNNSLKGKIAVLSFYNSDSVTNKNAAHICNKSMQLFRNNPDIVFVNVFTNKNNLAWQMKQAESNNYGKNVINVSTGGLGVEHRVVRDYVIKSFPWIWVMDVDGKALNASPMVDFTKDNGELLAKFIQKKIDKVKLEHQKELSYRKDGPYVFHNGDNAVAYSIDNDKLTKANVNKSEKERLKVQTDLDNTFPVHLQQPLAVEPAVFAEASKLIVFSDIEGNFDAFRKLLQNNKVIDSNFNWVFGNGHLVFAGDMFDRGMQVTECLWLMYSLEEKAKAKGGYVHFVLGNHDIMNMQGNHKYTTKKYKDNAALMGKTLTELYNENSEIGRWLRTKNVIEKIGGLLFVHGGVSPEVNELSMDIEAINATARPYYDKRVDTANKNLMTIYDTRKGKAYRISPFWSRSYYKGEKVSMEQLDFTLNKFNVRRIVTGHTIVADTISVHYNRKVINTDTKHAKGKSEALLIENDHYYRVNDSGEKVLLFIEDKLRRGN